MALEGTYRVIGEAMGKKVEGTLEFKQVGGTIKGTAEAAGQKVTLQDLKVSGDSFTGKASAATPMGNMKFTISGSVKGDRISGTLKAFMVNASFEGSRI